MSVDYWQKKLCNSNFGSKQKAFVIHVIFLGLEAKILILPACETQIVLLWVEKVTIPAEYLDYSEVFSKKSAAELPKRSDLNKYLINLELGKQPLYSLIYSLRPVELETFKTYIKISWPSGLIWSFKSLAEVPILFVQKPDSNFRLCVNYRGLKNITIKNLYLLPLISKLLN